MLRRLLLAAAALLAILSVVILPIFLGPLALAASTGAILAGARRSGLALLLVSAMGMAAGMYLGCRTWC